MLNAKQAAAELGIQPFGYRFATGGDWKNREESGLKIFVIALQIILVFLLIAHYNNKHQLTKQEKQNARTKNFHR